MSFLSEIGGDIAEFSPSSSAPAPKYRATFFFAQARQSPRGFRKRSIDPASPIARKKHHAQSAGADGRLQQHARREKDLPKSKIGPMSFG